MLTSLIAIALGQLGPAGPADGASRAGLSTEYLYHGVDRPVMIEVHSTQDFASVVLVLLDAEGREIVPRVDVRAGHVDLASVMPDLWRLRKAAWLQLLVSGVAEGPPLVVQPTLSRLVPKTEDAVNPSGIRYTRIVGWFDENHPPAATERTPAAVEAPAAPAEGVDADPVPVEASGDYGAWLAPSGGDERLLTGVRMYIDRDVVMETTLGEVRIALRPDAAPNTAWNFRRLCADGFYRDIAFHRIVPLARNGAPFVIQAGDPSATGSGGPGYWMPMERSDLPHDFGVISMARDVDPDSAGSQIFFCLSREGTARLDGHYCAFGEAIGGADVIRAIADVELADVAAGRPADAPRIVGTHLTDAPARPPGTSRASVAQQETDAPTETGPTRVPR